MKFNYYLVAGIICIIFGIILFLTDFFNPVIRPVTYLFLMGSSKGKDIMFFVIIGFFLILSQLHKIKKIPVRTSNKFLKVGIILSAFLLVSGILLEIYMRHVLGLSLTTIFASMNPSMATTSILHSHIFKSVFGSVLTGIAGPIIPSDINTGYALYGYIPDIANLLILLLPVIGILLIIGIQNRPLPSTIWLCFASSCLIIGILDGGLFSTPGIIGICGTYWAYRNGFYIDYLIGKALKNQSLQEQAMENEPEYRKIKNLKKFAFKRAFPAILTLFIVFLRLSITFLGANTEYYEVEVFNPNDNVDLSEFNIISTDFQENKTVYHFNSSYNEMSLLNELKTPLKDKCDYYSLSWNGYSYL